MMMMTMMILNGLGVDKQCDKQTVGQTFWWQ